MLKDLRVTQRGSSTGLDVIYVFIPAGGAWSATYYDWYDTNGLYWSTTYNHPSPALTWLMNVSLNDVSWGYTVYPFYGLSISLVIFQQDVGGVTSMVFQALIMHIFGVQHITIRLMYTVTLQVRLLQYLVKKTVNLVVPFVIFSRRLVVGHITR